LALRDAAYLLLCISEPSKDSPSSYEPCETSGDSYYPRAIRISLIMPSQARELIAEARTLCRPLCPPDPMEGWTFLSM